MVKSVYGIEEVESALTIEELYPNCQKGWAWLRLGHSNSITHPERNCSCFDKTDVVKCFYIFGETILETTHRFGECPWKQ